MIIGALVGAAIGAGVSIATQKASGHSINWGEVGTQAAVGALSGAISGLAGPEAGLAVHALIGAASGMAGQLVNNAMTHKPLGDGVLMAGLIGGATVGLGEGVGGPLLSKLLGKAAGEAAGVAEDAERGVAREAGGEVEDAAGEDVPTSCAAMSFAPGTAVATPKGEKPIASLKVGDRVIAYDPKTGKTTPQTVRRVWINHDTDLLDVTVRIGGGQTVARHRTPTDSRPARGGRALLARLALGALAVVAALAAPLHVHAARATVSRAVTSHAEIIHTTANHPWLTADRGWVLAGQLHVGEPVQRADGTTAAVVALRVVPGAASMWDLTLDRVHTFAVGAGQYIVHNCGETGDEGEPPQGYGEAHNAANAAKLRQYAQYVDKYGQPRELADGRIRFYPDSLEPPDNPGRVIGARYVKEWNPETGATRGWYESLEADGSVRIVHPKDINGTNIDALHYLFDHGRYEGSF